MTESASWSSRRPVLDGADDCGKNRPGNTAAGHLADDAADIRRLSAVGKQRNQHTEELSPGAAADRTRDGVSEGSEIDILGHAGGDIAAYGATDNLDDQIDEQSRHDALLPDPGVNFRDICTAPDHRRTIQLKRLKARGHAACAKVLAEMGAVHLRAQRMTEGISDEGR